jgi:hypothetical protein
VFSEMNTTALEPVWTPDGNYIVVRRGGRGGGEGGGGGAGLYMYHKDGGTGVPLVAAPAGGRGAGGGGGEGPPSWPTVTRDGRYLYYQVGNNVADGEPISGAQQIKRFEFRTGSRKWRSSIDCLSRAPARLKRKRLAARGIVACSALTRS